MIESYFYGRVIKSMGTSTSTEVGVSLQYDEDNDQLAVNMIFTQEGSPDEVVWTFARSLLDAGTTSLDGAGDGDVRFTYNGNGIMLLSLTNQDGHAADIRLPRSRVVDFLSATYAAVELGEEDMEGDLDEALKEILGSLD